MSEKSLLRQQLRARHPGREVRNRESVLMCGHILASDLYRNARIIGGYMPLAREADVMPVLTDVLHTGRTLALPLCGQAPDMTLRRVASLDDLVPGSYGILEPRVDTEIIPVSQLDLLLVPLEGIDPQGRRLGKGGGYYDCLLSKGSPVTLGCALSWQWTDQIPCDPWDKPLHACADRHGVHMFDSLIHSKEGKR